MKKTLSFILSLVMVFGILTNMPLTVKAATVDDLMFELNEDGKSYSVTGWNEEPNGKIVIPDTYNGLSVTNICEFAFSNCYNLTSIVIPYSVISIEHNAFSYCSNLTSITIPDSVTSISSTAFNSSGYYKDDSNWENGVLYIGNHLIEAQSDISGSYEIKNATKTIADLAFYNCESLTSVTIPDSVTSIGMCAFDCCESLTSVTIPDSVTSIGNHAFEDCTSLTSIEVDSGNLNYASNSGVLFNKEKTNLIQYPIGRVATTYKIPNGVTNIGDSAFSYCERLTSVILPDSVTNIGNYSFYECTSLASITIPDSVTSIGDSAFSYCESLTSITIPDSVTSIGEDAFSYCESLTSITIPDSVTTIGKKAFYYTGYHNNDSNWENGVLYIGNHLIEAQSDISGFYEIKTGTKNIADYAFKYCKGLTSIIIPDSVTNIGEEAFNACRGLTSVTIPNSVTNIERCAFYGCINLTSVRIPDSVTSIGRGAFGYYMYGEKADDARVDDFKIYGTKGTAAEVYANENGFKFIDKNHKHTPSSWITDKKATADTAGKKHKECTECGEILETATIKQLKCSKPKLSKISNTSSGVKITWGKVSGADTYRVYRKTKNGSWKYLGSTSKTSYTDKTAKSGTKYYYAVRARNEAGNSSLSSSLSKYYLADPTLKTPKSTKNGVSLKWTKTTGAQGYIIYRKTGSGSYKKLKTEKGVSNLSYVDKSAKKGKKYTYKVKAYYSKTYSAYSNTKTIKDKY